MTVVSAIGQQSELYGVSGDTKPTTNIKPGSTFRETDTDKMFVYDGSVWDLVETSGQQGAAGDTAATNSTGAWSIIALLKGIYNLFAPANAANTVRTTATVVTPVQVIDATGKVLKAGDTAANAYFTKVTDGTNTMGVDAQGQIGIGAKAGTPGTTNYRRLATADTNLVNIKASAGKIVTGTLHNTSAATKYVKLYNKASAPVLASDTPVLTVPIAANGYVNIIINDIGIFFATGISMAITGGAGDTDATAVAANDVVVNMSYI